jgi:hypothetical protein
VLGMESRAFNESGKSSTIELLSILFT